MLSPHVCRPTATLASSLDFPDGVATNASRHAMTRLESCLIVLSKFFRFHYIFFSSCKINCKFSPNAVRETGLDMTAKKHKHACCTAIPRHARLLCLAAHGSSLASWAPDRFSKPYGRLIFNTDNPDTIVESFLTFCFAVCVHHSR